MLKITPIHITTLVVLIWMGCSSERKRVHFFLDGYPELIFKDANQNPVPTDFFIRHVSKNGVSTFEVRDTTLRLHIRESEDLYTGYIRTYHWGMNNVEAVFEEGKIQRLRFWHPNRVLGQDSDYNTGVGKVWNFNGALSISWDKKETIFLNTTTSKIRQVTEDTLTTFFDFEGVISRYTIRTDSAFEQFYPDGSPRFYFPVLKNGLREGVVRRWHQNGQLQAIGEYRNGREYGTWFEYDSLGNEINREEW